MNKLYFSKLSNPEEFSELHSIQLQINELYSNILESQKQMGICSITVEDHHKEFYNKFDKILK